MRTQYRLGIDAGGTFTDFVLADRAAGSVEIYKTLSTPHDPTEAIQNGLGLIANDLKVDEREIISQCDLCINGTTVGLNALIQHKGAKVGLICTAGHEDSVEIRLGHKEDGYRYDAEYPPAVMLVPRYLRRGVRERVLSNGEIRTPMEEEDVRDACRRFQKEAVEAVAISFLWSVLNKTHEMRAAEIVREMLPGVILTVGSELYPQVREYTRTSTAITNAYLAPILKKYVAAVDQYFQDMGAENPVRYFQSNGGLAIGQAMTDRSVYAINSGPASAPQAALNVCEPFGHKNVITVDMGGTSFDITLARDGITNLNKNIDFLRYRIGVPMIQVETLGAGGGSIGWIDEMGLLQMGPQSAGSNPGPACYGRGGSEPTVSDANLVLGYLNPEGLVGGRLPLDYSLSHRAIEERIARPLNISVEKAAYGMFTIVNNNMVNGIRRVSVERGYDPRDFVLVAAGGATGGPYHGARNRDGDRHHHRFEAELRALCVRPDHIGREIQLHGHDPRAFGRPGDLRPHRRVVQGNRGQGCRALVVRRFCPGKHRHPTQHGDALRRPDPRLHGRHRFFRYQRANHRTSEGGLSRAPRTALHLFRAQQSCRTGEHREHALWTGGAPQPCVH